MIILKLIGGIGNQMYQYAFGRHLSIINDTELKFDISYQLYRGDFEGDNIEMIYDVFNIEKKIASENEIKKFTAPRVKNRYIHHIKQRLIKENNVIRQKGLFVQEGLLGITGEYYIDGFWQSEKYFKKIKDIILKDFTFKKTIIENEDILSGISENNSVSIHIRKKDYLSKINKALFFQCETEYYKKAFEIIKERVQNPHFYIFSDDFSYFKENLDFIKPFHLIDKTSLLNSQEDLHLMSLCKHNITANSSFSWWGAYLNKNPGKIVIAPHKWYNDESIYAIGDFIPKEWITV